MNDLTPKIHKALTAYVNSRDKAYQVATRKFQRPKSLKTIKAIQTIRQELAIAQAQGKTFHAYCVMINRIRPEILAILPPVHTCPSQESIKQSALGILDVAEKHLYKETHLA